VRGQMKSIIEDTDAIGVRLAEIEAEGRPKASGSVFAAVDDGRLRTTEMCHSRPSAPRFRRSALVSYIRVSTQKQGRSGLGLEAQRDAIKRFSEAHNCFVAKEFTEVETGKGADSLSSRPHLSAPFLENGGRYLGMLARAFRQGPIAIRIFSHFSGSSLVLVGVSCRGTRIVLASIPGPIAARMPAAAPGEQAAGLGCPEGLIERASRMG
jgi:Resolvase, N terminal domain